MNKTASLFLMGLPAALWAQFGSIDINTYGSHIQFENFGNIYLDGHCYGNVDTLPVGGVANFYGPGTAKNGNLYFKGVITEDDTVFPGLTRFGYGGVDRFSIEEDGDFHLAKKCVNTAGCSNTQWLDSSYWNNSSLTQDLNNCYNYANDKVTDSFAQPGRGSGSVWTTLSVDSIRAASLRDGLVWVGWDFPGNTYDCLNGNLVFMAVSLSANDYHWWRFDHKSGAWSQKQGPNPSSNLDASGNPISNPLTSNRAHYTEAGGFYCLCGGRMNIE